MLVNTKELLLAAQRNRTAVAAFNFYSYETLKGVLDAAEQAGLPVIAALGERYLGHMPLAAAAALTRALAEASPLPVALHLDHCAHPDVVAAALREGFTSVMFDGSALPFAENLRLSRQMAREAHARGVTVEAELGSLGAGTHSNEAADTDRQQYTDPEQAARFAAKTGVDSLAVSIGTVHGFYKSAPNIRLDVLRAIRAATDIPLVLHGGSGTPRETLRACIENGVCKVNVNTELSAAAVAATVRMLGGAGKTPTLFDLGRAQAAAVADTARETLLFLNGR